MEQSARSLSDDFADHIVAGSAAIVSQERKQRREVRTETNWIGIVRLVDGTEIPCTIKDVSPSGAKLGVPANHPLPNSFMVKVLGRDFVCLVKIAWRHGNYVGVHIERIGKLKPAEPKPASTPESTPHEAATPTYTSVGARRDRLSSF